MSTQIGTWKSQLPPSPPRVAPINQMQSKVNGEREREAPRAIFSSSAMGFCGRTVRALREEEEEAPHFREHVLTGADFAECEANLVRGGQIVVRRMDQRNVGQRFVLRLQLQERRDGREESGKSARQRAHDHRVAQQRRQWHAMLADLNRRY